MRIQIDNNPQLQQISKNRNGSSMPILNIFPIAYRVW